MSLQGRAIACITSSESCCWSCRISRFPYHFYRKYCMRWMNRMTVDACCAQCCIPRRRRVRMQIRIRSKCISTCLMSAAAAAVRVVPTGENFKRACKEERWLGSQPLRVGSGKNSPMGMWPLRRTLLEAALAIRMMSAQGKQLCSRLLISICGMIISWISATCGRQLRWQQAH